MLIVISDLHLQHTSSDVFRYQDEKGEARECGVHRNISPEALTLLKDEIVRYRGKFQNKDVKLVLNGDIFEILRTPIWLEQDLRPYHEGLPPENLRPIVLKILDHIAADNQEFLDALKQHFVRKIDENGEPIAAFDGLTIEIVYLPGNHDRLLNAWPETRRKVRDLLGMKAGDQPFPHQLVLTRDDKNENYGVLIRHGHEYDKFNYVAAIPNERPEDRYLRSPLGDVLALEVGAALAFNFKGQYAKEMQKPKEGEVHRKLYLALLDFDDVRPDHTTFDYLTFALNRLKNIHGTNLNDEVAELMRPILAKACDAILHNKFFKRPGTPWTSRFLTTPLMCMLILWLLQKAPASKLVWFVKTALRIKGFTESAPPAVHAAREDALKAGSVDVVIAGHTHHHDQVPIEVSASETGYFLDTGTWRTLIFDGPGDIFGHLKSLTYVTVHKNQAQKSGRRFDTWTGHLASSNYGAYDQKTTNKPLSRVKKVA